ncbi:aldehyde dehydrogenase family protein [Alicyclobacillus cycloheptanicus]|uniref:1-pyrroline-5-carboxylate dehydrogenase n=1 Tax=Alicyclobacillus cycloheptanicus TaxID=1457 RepID=A0ABT9XD42_9BACL|nr:aldehyde dehydrogenase family protein [Alicyclobacillus cycloheptanicus]MDQ0188217.1 1-pyrroline-5-carboxylate dehydrogenase [Alicyclobacillus cycloheptanicus]WDM00947.1 aldehyde dehydrogenase family protein [Alicyclobacillus cycloheptanicus]
MLDGAAETTFVDLQDAFVRTGFERELLCVRGQLGQACPLEIGGERILTAQRLLARNPSANEEVVAEVSMGDARLLVRGLDAAKAAAANWKRQSFTDRARYLLRAAAFLRQRQTMLSAWICLGTGMTWAESTQETRRAVASLEACGQRALRLGEGVTVTYLGTDDHEQRYIPLGVGVVLADDRQSFAQTVAQAAAAMAAGNTVVLIPAVQTAVTASKWLEVMRLAGLPDGVLNLVPAASLHDAAAVAKSHAKFVLPQGSSWKDTVVVDEQAAVEEAAQQIVRAAFGWAGQAPGACARVIAHEAVYEDLTDRLVELTQQLVVGDAADARTQMGPLVGDAAREAAAVHLAACARQGRLLYGGRSVGAQGWFMEPAIVGDLDANAQPVASDVQGPVLLLTEAPDFAAAVAMANQAGNGQVASVFSDERSHLEDAMERLDALHLFVNQTCSQQMAQAWTESAWGGPDMRTLMRRRAVWERLAEKR